MEKTSPFALRKAQRIWLLALLGVVVIGVVLFQRSMDVRSSDTESQSVLAVSTLVAQKQQSYEAVELYPGRVRPARESALGFERGGLLAQVLVEEGAQVTEGQVLARLDQRALTAQRDAALARVASAKAAYQEVLARLQLAEATEARQATLLDKGHISQQRFDDARFATQSVAAQATSAKAQIRQADADLINAQVALSLSDLTAPYAGQIIARLSDEGTVLAPGTPVLRLQESGAKEFVTGVPSTALAALEPGATYSILVGKRAYEATLANAVGALDRTTRTAQMVFTLPSDADVVAGDVGRLTLKRTFDVTGLWVPVEALQEAQRGLWAVYALGERSGDLFTLEQRPVELIYNDMQRAYVRGTIEAGDVIVSGGLNRLVAGQIVRRAPSSQGR